MEIDKVLISAHVKEKSLSMRDWTDDKEEVRRSRRQNKLVFMVDRKASKGEVKTAVERLLKVRVVKVNTLHVKEGKRAIVTLHPSDRADAVADQIGAF